GFLGHRVARLLGAYHWRNARRQDKWMEHRYNQGKGCSVRINRFKSPLAVCPPPKEAYSRSLFRTVELLLPALIGDSHTLVIFVAGKSRTIIAAGELAPVAGFQHFKKLRPFGEAPQQPRLPGNRSARSPPTIPRRAIAKTLTVSTPDPPPTPR